MNTIQHEVWIDAPQQVVYELLASAEAIGTWWDKQTHKETPKGVVFEHSPGPDHGTVQFLVLASEPNHLVKWRCISDHPANVPASEWKNTEMTFEIGNRDSSKVASESWASAIPVQTVIKFQHTGWPTPSKYLPFCNKAWGDVLNNLKKKGEEIAN